MLKLFRTSISAITLLLLFLATPSFATEQGLKLFEQQNYDAAFRASFASALRGDARSQYVIGRILISGLGSSETNTTDGLDFLEKAARQSFIDAAIFLADEYEAGGKVDPSKRKALDYLLIAQSSGASGIAQRSLDLTISVEGAVVKRLWLYSPNDENGNERIARCIEGSLREGSPGRFWLAAYDGNANALIRATQYLLDPLNTADYDPKVLLEIEGFTVQDEDLAKSLDTAIQKAANGLKEADKHDILFELAIKLKETDRMPKQWIKLLKLAAKGSGVANLELADLYLDGGGGVSASQSKELEYLLQAEANGVIKLGPRIHKLRVAEDRYSKPSCRGYNKKDKSLAGRLARCVEKGHIDGNAIIGSWLMSS